MMTLVKSIAGLRRDVEAIRDYEINSLKRVSCSNALKQFKGGRIDACNIILKLIDSLGAGLRGRLEKLENSKFYIKPSSGVWTPLTKQVEELRRVLGDVETAGSEPKPRHKFIRNNLGSLALHVASKERGEGAKP